MSTDNMKEKPAMHFETHAQQHDAGKFGVWVFMGTEVMMFGAMFVGYFIYRALYPEGWAVGSSMLNWKQGTFNTFVLLASSFTMAQAVTYVMQGQNKKSARMVWLTLLGAITFMVVKYFEYSHKFHAGAVPGWGLWDNPQMDIPGVQLFMTFYFFMTILHGIHILIGMGLMIWLLKRFKRDEFNTKYFTAVEGVGLYWHIVDVIWIFLFPLMYLV